LDLSAFPARIRAVAGGAGRPPIDPAILVALWIYAAAQGVGSARARARLCDEHDAYRWLCGGVSVNHHTLSGFRTGHGPALDALLTQSVAALMAEGLVTLERVAQDGVRVRASAAAASFRSKDALGRCLQEANEQVEALRKEFEEAPSATTVRAAARTRAARERKERIARAIAHREAAAKRKPGDQEKEDTRASTTDPECRVMKMPDGGFRPGFNAQFSTDTGSKIVVGVDVSNIGNDNARLISMLEQPRKRYGKTPTQALVDAGYAKLDDIETLSEAGTEVYAPMVKPKNGNRAPEQARWSDGPGVAAWRIRRTTAEAKEIDKERASTAECVNALAHNRGPRQVLVRGLEKVRRVLLWFPLAHNLLRGGVAQSGCGGRRREPGGVTRATERPREPAARGEIEAAERATSGDFGGRPKPSTPPQRGCREVLGLPGRHQPTSSRSVRGCAAGTESSIPVLRRSSAIP